MNINNRNLINTNKFDLKNAFIFYLDEKKINKYQPLKKK
jgi:hypothetical protein